jgi:ribosomal protein S18 acetylase RimI-like enzyme
MIEFRPAKLPDELEALQHIDQLIFADYPGDLFSDEDWLLFDSHWMLEDGQIVGCAAFLAGVDFDFAPRPGCIHIMTTGVLPEHRGRGLGKLQKQWEIEFARSHGFQVIVTNTRRSNLRMIHLNEAFGFHFRQIAPGFYPDPPEDAVVMELRLT